MKCPVCDGAGISFTYKKAITCPNCKGKGTLVAALEVERKYKIAIVSETWTDNETAMQMPFVGSVGELLNELLEAAEIDRQDCYLTTVFPFTPSPRNDVEVLCVPKKVSHVPMPDIKRGKYLDDRFFHHVQRLWDELDRIRPNVVITLGPAALWALTGNAAVKSLRGTATEATYGASRGLKVIPTYDIKTIFKDWSVRPIIIADFIKAGRQSDFPQIIRPSRKIWLDPDLRDIEMFYQKHVLPSKKLSVDIETVPGQITCIGFAPSRDLALVIPFVDNRKPGGSYWPTAHQEKLAWFKVKQFLQHTDNPEIRILGQNFLYDINWLWHLVGMPPRNFYYDTMLKHHAMHMEMDKGLGFLGSIYTDEPAWKLMRKNTDSTKRGE